MKVSLGNIKRGTFFAKWLASTAISVPEFPIPTTRTRLSLNMSGCLYCRLWKYCPLKFFRPIEKTRAHRELINSVNEAQISSSGNTLKDDLGFFY